MTKIAVELQEDIAERLASAWRDMSRGTLEAVALETYRNGMLGREQVGRALGLSFWEMEAFLKERQAYFAYDEQDLQDDTCRSRANHANRASPSRGHGARRHQGFPSAAAPPLTPRPRRA